MLKPLLVKRGLGEIGATGFEPATFRPPADERWALMLPGASPTSPGLDDLDASELAVGTKAVLQTSQAEISDPI